MAAAFFVIYYFYIWLIIEPKLLYYAFGRTLPYYPFLTGWEFFTDSFTTVGGPAAYFTGLLSQCFYFSWPGALIITVIGLLFWLLWSRIAASAKTEYLAGIGYLFAVFVLATYTSYDNQLYNFLSLLTALAALTLYLKIDTSKALSFIVFIMIDLILYYIAKDVVIVFGLLAVLCEMFIRNRKWFAAVLAVCPALHSIGMYLFDFSVLHYTFSLMDILAVAAVLFIGCCRMNLFQTMAGRLRQILPMPVKSAIPFLLIILTFCVSYKKTAKLFLELGYYADSHQWQKVLDCAGRYPRPMVDFLSIHDVNRALYYTGRLSDTMFSYDQAPNALLLSYASSPSDSRIWAKLSRKMDTFLELGDLGDAQRYASEILESTNQCPYTLKQIALICLARNQNETAKVYLNVLAKDLIYGRFARDLLERMEYDPRLADYEPVLNLRSVAVRTDNVGEYDPDLFFAHALQRNPQNKMAFEYMMAFYLSMGEIEKFVANLGRLQDFSYPKIPIHYEEAMLVYAASGGDTGKLKDFSPSPETIQRFKQFDEEFAALCGRGYNRQAVMEALSEKFGDSYMFYSAFILEGQEDG